MVKAEWGLKRICKKCSVSFYDLTRDPIVCPKCTTSFTPADFTSKYAKGLDKAEARREAKRLLEEEAPDILVEEDIEEEALIENEDDFDQEVALIERPAEEEDR